MRGHLKSNIPITHVLMLAILLVPALGRAGGACTPGSVGSGWRTVTVRSGGLAREVALYVPAAALGRSHLPLVFDLHGSVENARLQALNSRLSMQADRHGFLLANPEGGIHDPASPADKLFWNMPGVPLFGDLQTPADAPDDVQFFRDAIDQIGRSACVDSHRVYVTGFSGGARMASLLACELADRIAAIAAVAGVRAGLTSARDPPTPETRSCAPRRPVSVVTFHSANDPVNRFNGDRSVRWGYGVPAALTRWAQIDGCRAAPSERRVSAHVTVVRYLGCRGGTEVMLYRIDASALLWEFFARHRS